MSLVEQACPGCSLLGGPHFYGCPSGTYQDVVINNTVDLTKQSSIGYNGAMSEKTAVTEEQTRALESEKYTIEQKVIPSTGTKLVCTDCGNQNWHTLILRRKAGLLEALCKQVDGSGCYPLATRRNCSYTYPEGMDCPQVAEYCIALGDERRAPRQVCRDHVGEMLRQGPLYQVWPLAD